MTIVSQTAVKGVVPNPSGFNDQFALMAGGRVSITINNRNTIREGGYGIANSTDLPGSGQDTISQKLK